MIKYNLVIHDRGWVMEKLANHFAKYLPNSSIRFRKPIVDESTINFYFNWHGINQKTFFDVGFFTHIENGARKLWDGKVRVCDLAVLLGNKYEDTVPENKRIIFNPPPFEQFLSNNKIKILVVGREYSSDRKNLGLYFKLKQLENIDISFTGGKLTEEELIQAYKETDYVLVTSKIESGPMCVVEALAMKKPIIAPDVGWCWDFPCIKYYNEDELMVILNQLYFSQDSWKFSVDILDKKVRKALTDHLSGV